MGDGELGDRITPHLHLHPGHSFAEDTRSTARIVERLTCAKRIYFHCESCDLGMVGQFEGGKVVKNFSFKKFETEGS